MKLWQKRMTSCVALSLGIKIRPAFSAAHREGREAVLEHLLERKEFQDAESDGGMEAKPAFVRSDGAVHLDPEAAVDVDFSLVIHPRDAEHDHAFRLHHPFEDFGAPVFRMPFKNEFKRLRDLLDCLMKFRLRRILGFHMCDEIADVI